MAVDNIYTSTRPHLQKGTFMFYIHDLKCEGINFFFHQMFLKKMNTSDKF